MGNLRLSWVEGLCLLLATLATPAALHARKELTLEELKARIANASTSERPSLCLQVAERQLDAADRFYAAGDEEKAQASLEDVVAFSEMTRDAAIQSHKHEKQSEIALRKMTRKLNDLKRAVTLEDQKTIQESINHLQRIRDDLLAAMFPKGDQK
jgi:hypothetical protein